MGIRISEMEEATTFGADDYVPIVTNGTNKKALGQKIKDFIAGFFATKTGDNISDKATFRSAIEISATNTPFDNTGTGLSASNVQAAITELTQVVEAVIRPMNNKFTQRDSFKAVQKCGWITIKSFVNITTAVNASESFAKITLPTIGGGVLAVNSSTRAVYPCTVAANGSVVSDGSMPTGYYYFYGNIMSL